MRDKLNDPARLALMRESIDTIEDFLQGIVCEEAFLSNKILCHAVLYNLQCIGESVYRLSEEFRKNNSSIDWPAIEGLRHVLVHDYYNVDLTKVWLIITDDLPVLKDFLDKIAPSDKKSIFAEDKA